MDRTLAENIGIDLSGKVIEARSLTGRLRAVKVLVNLSLDDGSERHSLAIPALVTMDPTNEVKVVLGRGGFFNHFTITFLESSHSIVFERNTLRGSVAMVERNMYLRSRIRLDTLAEKTAIFSD